MSETLLIDIKEVQRLTGMGERTIEKRVTTRQFPMPKVIPGVRKRMWTRASVEQWVRRLKDAA